MLGSFCSLNSKWTVSASELTAETEQSKAALLHARHDWTLAPLMAPYFIPCHPKPSLTKPPFPIFRFSFSLALTVRMFGIFRFFRCIFAVFPVFQGKKKHININKLAGLSRDWVGAKILFMCFLGHSLWGRKNHINKFPPKIPGQSREIFIYMFFLYVFFGPKSRPPIRSGPGKPNQRNVSS